MLFLLGFLSGVIISYISLLIYRFKIKRKNLGDINDKKRSSKVSLEIEELIKNEQYKVWKNFTNNTEVNIKTLMEESVYLIKEIAKKYYPESSKPELEVTTEELLKMNIAVSQRALEKLEMKPFSLLKKIKLYHINYTKNRWDEIKESKMYKKLKKYRVWEFGKKVWMGINFLNLGYWLRKVGYNFTREFLIRLFRANLIGIIGEEADILYSGDIRKDIKKIENKKEIKE